MNLALDPETEQRIQREVELGRYRDPEEVVAHAVTLLLAEDAWLMERKTPSTSVSKSAWHRLTGEREFPEINFSTI